jgi:hypothetical protein
LDVFNVAAEPNGKDITEYWHGADHRIQSDIQAHTQYYDFRQAILRGDEENSRARDVGKPIADARNQPKDRVEADADRGPRDGESLIKQLGQKSRKPNFLGMRRVFFLQSCLL